MNRLSSRLFVLLMTLMSTFASHASKLYELKIVDKDYVMIHFKDGDVLTVDDGLVPGSPLFPYNFDDQSNNYVVNYGNSLNTTNARNILNWKILSSTDGNYAGAGQAPTEISFKSKRSGTHQASWNFVDDWNYEYTQEHFVILKLPNSLKQGDTYTVEIDGSVRSDTETIDFTFDFLTSRSDAIHVNTVGYTDDNTTKAVDLYMWLGDKGGRDYTSFQGNQVYLINVANGNQIPVGQVAFGQSKTSDTHGYDYTQADVWHADFTYSTSGTYRLAIEGVGCSDEFEIKKDIYYEPFKVSTLGFFYMRIGESAAGIPADQPKPRQPSLDPNTSSAQILMTTVHPFDPSWNTIAADQWDSPPKNWPDYVIPNQTSNAEGGHSDARDMDRHLGHCSIIWDMLLPYILTGGDAELNDDNLGIPESGNGIPDLLDEARDEVDFWLSVRDQNNGYGWGITNPINYTDNQVMYQAAATPYAAWTNAVNCAMLAESFRLAGNQSLRNFYQNEAIAAYNEGLAAGSSSTAQMLDKKWGFGESWLTGADLKFTAAAYLYNLTGNTTYENTMEDLSLNKNSTQDMVLYKEYCQLWGAAAYLTTNRTVNKPTLFQNMKTSIINSAIAEEAGLINSRPTRRAVYESTSFWQTVHDVNRTIIAHAITDDPTQKADFLKALLFEADWGLGRNPLNIIQMTTASTNLHLNKSLENIFTTGADDGAPGQHPGHTPYLSLTDFGGNSVADKTSLLLATCVPNSNDWAVGELYFSTQHVYAHTEFTPQQTMRGKQALYGYLYGLSNGRTNAPSTYKLTVEGGSGSGNLASGATRTISAGSETNGQVFKEWISNSRYVLDYYVDDPRSATTTVTMPEGNIWLQATYESPKYELTVNGGYGGGFYKAGEEVTIFANTPSNGQKFNQWQGNASNFSFPASNANQSAAAKIIMPAQDITYTGLFNNGQETYATCGELENVSFERSFFTFGQTNITMSTEARTDYWAVQGLGGPAIFKNGIDASGHNSYELTIWVKSIGDVNGSSVGLDFIDAGGAEVGKEFINVASDPDWQELSILGGIPNGTVEVRFWTWVNQGNILYDDICLVFDGNPNFNPVTGVTMTPNALTLNVGESSQLNTQIQPSNATNQGLTYTSSNTNVVTVSSTGFVDAIGGGVATITVTTDEGGYTDQTSVTVNGSNSNQTPYVTHTIPGNIEGEYYDNGGQGVAYNDDATRDGDLSFRPDDKVDVDSKAPASNGKSVGWTVPGEWLEYTISSVSGGTYDITFAFASGATSQGNLQVSLDGNVIATFTDITSTGDWSTFSNTTVSDVAIAGGSNQILRLEVIGSVANFDIDAITFTNTGGGNIPVTGVNLTPTSLTLNVGQSQPLSVNVLPNNATNQAISYSSSNTNVATVNGSGVVTAVGDGNATITVTTDDGGFTDQTSITVNPSNIPVTGVSLSPTNLTLNVGQTQQLTKSVQPSNATNRTVSYTSSNNNVATVNNNGVVNAIAAGNATITVTTADGSFTDQTNVTVNGGGNSGGDLIIRAKGDTGDEIMELRISNTVVKIWSITSSWDTYVYAGYSGVNTIQVAHTNDGLNGDGLDKNMQVDYIETNGTIYQTNQSATLNGGCGDINTEYLWCNAYFEYLGIDGGSGNSNVAVTGVSLNPASITLNVGQAQQLTATVQPSNATNQAVSYASSNTNVATVSGSGVVSATGAGSATITVTTTDGGFTDQTSVTVNTPNVAVTGVNLTPANVTLDVGQTQQLTATVQPSNATNQTVSYASGNTSVATVNASGLVTAVAVGSAPITVTTADGSFTDQTNVTVSSSNSGGDLIIRAKGDTGEETMELQVNDVTVGGWNLTAAWADYTYSGYTGTNDIKVVHTNDGPSSNGGDKNMQADYIQVGGVTYETNQTAVLGGGCGDLNTEYLWCNNTYFLYSNISAGGSANAVENRSKSYDLATVKVYPNPVSSSQIMLDVQELDGIYEINIFDLNGRNVFRQTSNLGKVSISPNLSNGTYLLVLSNQFEVSNHKLIVLNE